ncbi:MAG: carbamoyltransferase HypF [Anaerolineae bacterium]|nr:carbamoyltransferase HypF [Anaerolineae bacterium]
MTVEAVDAQKRIARRISITGVVQGVGFRPFVYNLAREKGLAGWVLNHSGGVDIEAEGSEAALEAFIIDLEAKSPPLAGIESLAAQPIPLRGLGPFEIRPSRDQAGRYQLISPDVATCPDCLRELLDPKDRRYRYPFINCTNCGPRFTIIEDIPYDRAKTTMRVFPMCDDCLAEYEDPGNRRFHAQPNACPVCGPQVWLVESAISDQLSAISERSIERASDKASKREDDQVLSGLGASAPASSNQHPASNIQHPASDIVFARARELLLAGKILAIKGLGGFHLACDATNAEAVATLRERKQRPHKPFAIMVATLDDVRALCEVPEEAEKLLASPQSPIVLLDARDNTPIAPNVAPNSHTLGVMIPTTPLHHILLRDVGRPLVMTSGNVTEEPIAKDNDEALRRLAPLADAFLLHNRDIHARYDDSVVQVVGNRRISEWENQRITESADERESEKAKKRKGNNAWQPVSKGSAIEDRPQRDASIQQPVLSLPKDPTTCPELAEGSNIQLRASTFTVPARRARGYAPFPIRLPFTVPQIFAAGPLLKNTFTLTRDHYAFVSQHIGDLENLDTLEHYEAALAAYQHLFRIVPEIVVSDLHPDYLSTRLAETFAREHSLPAPYRVQHHQAHIAACLADCGWSADAASADSGQFIGVALDGTGYGEDGHIWGGEWFVGDYRGFERVAHLAYLPLPGGDAAVRHPWRTAVAYLHALGLDGAMPLGEFCPADVMRVRTIVDRRLNTPLTSSMGRLFDAVSALLGICHETTYEAQAAIELEQITGPHSGTVAARHRITPYPFGLDTGVSPYQIQVGTLLDAILEDIERAEPAALIAQRFHTTIAAMIVTVCQRLRTDRGINVVALSGGVFQNRLLTALTLSQLTASGFEVLVHQQVPPNDGGISLGQAVMASFAHS